MVAGGSRNVVVANWSVLPNRWECKYQHGPRVRCRRCQMRELIYGERFASRHGGKASMAHGPERRAWWIHTWKDKEFRKHRAVAVDRLVEGMRRNADVVLAINGPREWVAIRCWQRMAGDAGKVSRMLRVAEAFEFERHGPVWGQVVGKVSHTDSGLLSALSRAWIVQADLPPAVMWPAKTYRTLRRMAPVFLEPARGWLVRYGLRSAWEWERLRVKGLKAQEKAIAQRIAEDREAERLQALDGKGDRE